MLGAAEQLDARAAAVVYQALEELEQLGEERTPGAELIELLEGLQVPVHGVPPAGTVLIAEPLAIRARRFRRVFVTGLCADEFPSPQAAITDPFLGDDRRRELALSSGLALPQPSDPLDRERYLLYACVSRATERVVFSYRSSDEDGNIVIASPFLDDVAELFPANWRERRRRRLLADVVWSVERGAHRARAGGRGGLRTSSGPIQCCGRRGTRHARPVPAGADPRAPPADRLRRCTRDVRVLPGEVAGGAPTATRSARSGSRRAHPRFVHSHGARARLREARERAHAADATARRAVAA